MRNGLSIALTVLISCFLAAASSVHSTSLYVGRELWTQMPDPSAALNTQLVPVRGWPAPFAVNTPVGWKVTPGEYVIDAVLALPAALASVLFTRRIVRRRSAAHVAVV
jgi:hypothetical protein